MTCTLNGGSSSSALEPIDLHRLLPADKVFSVDDVELEECISCGEFTIVHRGTLQKDSTHAQQPAHQRDVVVKMLHRRRCANDEQAAEELRAEIEIFADLSHPRLVTFVGACLEPKASLALVTALAPGGNLHQALHVRRRQLLRHERFQLATELLDGTGYLHGRRPAIAHLDLKSMNIVLDAEGQHLQICDFGLARELRELRESESENQRAVSRGGTPRYMAPECHDSAVGPLTEKADVWACGCIFIEIFAGTLPYAECSNARQILSTMLVQRCGPSIPESVEVAMKTTVMDGMLRFDAEQRLPIAEALQRLLIVVETSDSKSRFMWIP